MASKMLNFWYVMVFCFLILGCSTKKENLDEVKTFILPQEFSVTLDDSKEIIIQNWWKSFGSKELDNLISQTKKDNLDLQIAINRINQANANAKMIGADLYPQIDASLDGARSGSLKNDKGTNSFDASIQVNYEIDFWGKNRANYRSAKANLEATIFQKDEIELSIFSNVAFVYLNIVALNDRIDIAKLNLQIAKELFELVQTRYKSGVATQLEVTQQEILLLQQKRKLVLLEQELKTTDKTLAILLAKTKKSEIEKLSLEDLKIPNINFGLPSELLLRRPDIAQMEALMAAKEANIDVARVTMLPSLNLASGINTDGENLINIFDKPIYTLVAALSAPIFNGGKLEANYDLAKAQYEELVINYRQTIINAFWEVETVLSDIKSLDNQILLQTKELDQSQLALKIAQSKYESGAELLINLLDSQRNFYTAKDTAVQLKLARLLLCVELYKALGGEWRID